jgi:hypothetical protein
MEMLCELRAHELIVEYALKERDSTILGVASEGLDYHPPDLVRHFLTQPSSMFASLHMRFTVARGNFLYADDAIRSVYATRRSHTLDVIDGIGLAYIRSLSNVLEKYIRVPLNPYEGATRTGANGWSRAVHAVVALARMDAHSDTAHAEDRLADAIREGSVLDTRSKLEWALYDKGGPSTIDDILGFVKQGAIGILPDLASTLLKRQEYDRLGSLVHEYPKVFFVTQEFCYWPLMNWIEVKGILAQKEFGGRDGINEEGLYRYWRARERGEAPPPWWKWM